MDWFLYNRDLRHERVNYFRQKFYVRCLTWFEIRLQLLILIRLFTLHGHPKVISKLTFEQIYESILESCKLFKGFSDLLELRAIVLKFLSLSVFTNLLTRKFHRSSNFLSIRQLTFLHCNLLILTVSGNFFKGIFVIFLFFFFFFCALSNWLVVFYFLEAMGKIKDLLCNYLQDKKWDGKFYGNIFHINVSIHHGKCPALIFLVMIRAAIQSYLKKNYIKVYEYIKTCWYTSSRSGPANQQSY